MRSVRPVHILVESPDFHRLVVENTPDLISVHSSDGACLYVSPSSEATLGFTNEELTGADAFAHVHPDDRALLRETLRPELPAGAAPPTTFTTEIRCRHRKGHYVWLEIHGTRIAPEAPLDEQLAIFVSRHIASERLIHADQHEREIRRRFTPPYTDWYWEVDEDGRFTFFPEYEARAYGTPLLGVLGKTRQELADDPLSPGMLEYADKLARREPFKNIQYAYVSDENGSVAHAIISGEPFYRDGVFQGFRGVGRNITRGLKLKEQLAKLSSENQSLLDNSLDIIATADEAGRITRINAAAERILGYTQRQLVGKQYIDFFVPEDRDKTLAIVGQLYREGGEVFHFENRWLRPDGGIVHLAWSAHWSPDNHALHATGRDITQHHQARTQAQAFNERFTSMLESMGDAFFSLNRDWIITYTNRKTAEFVGQPVTALMGRPLADAVPEVLTSSVFPYYQRAMETREQLSFEAFYEPSQAWVEVRVYPHDDGISVFFNDVTERKQADARLEHLATHDYLTGLPNRVRLDMRLQDMLTEGDGNHSCGVFFIDLDRFKAVNDSLGHAAGDIVLCEVASRLTASIRPTDVIARLSGDEFVIVANCRNGADTARKLANKLLGLLSTPMMVRDKELYIGASIGISMFPEDGTTREILFQKADTAMYRAKLDGRDCFRFFTDSMREEVDARISIESELRRALERKQFEIHYQPRIDAKTLRTTAVEALIRWNHPTLGRVSPSQFIPIAEEIGIIQPIGAWVLENACRDILALSERRNYPLHLSVNLSARQLQPVTLCDHVRAILRSTGFPARLLELELTETALVEDIDRSADVLLELKNLGVHLSLDDFGTGYSSLTYLRRFPISLLKLDQTFMNDNKGALDTIRFLTAIIVFAHSLNLKVVAEGVEKRETLESLQWAGCDEVQGYLFAKPMPLPELERYIATGQDEITTGRWREL